MVLGRLIWYKALPIPNQTKRNITNSSSCLNLIKSSFSGSRTCHRNSLILQVEFGLSVFTRYASSQSKYSNTLNLPKTLFPISMQNGASAKRESDMQKRDSFSGLYEWQRLQKRQKEFILHDGPPYANGKPHVGHAINKILKDVTNRFKLLTGHRIHYIPGWDCHGLPIELKAIQKRKTDIMPLDLRKKARKFAQSAIYDQMNVFKRWGIMANWNDPYKTYTHEYILSELEIFYDLYKKGYVYQEYMPVYWSPSSKTALAEAELEYNAEHVSKSIHVEFPILKSSLFDDIKTDYEVVSVIWTTTPWTIPANKAIAYGEKIQYCLARRPDERKLYLVAQEFVPKLGDILGTNLNIVKSFQGKDLDGSTYSHPLYPGQVFKLLHGDHVTTEIGTGLVHIAPAHGHVDFQLAIKHQLPLECHIDGDGKYTDEIGLHLSGVSVLHDGNDKVISMLGSSLLHAEDYKHSYPYDWRTKKPVIIRASKQWFIDTGAIKSQTLKALEDVKIWSEQSLHGMLSQLDKRTYWCISRQRSWGVPIPVFFETGTGKPIISDHSIKHVIKLFGKYGSDCWWSLPTHQLCPPEVLEKSGFDPNTEVTVGKDILDIWFDSGISWAHVLKDSGGVADLYLEGVDQFGGWFQSSLLLSTAVQGKAPYKNLVAHGFTVDESGKKMSKSLGNVVDPEIVVNGGENKSKNPSYGADVLRYWAAQANLNANIEIGPNVLDKCQENIFKLRKIMRFMLGNNFDFTPDQCVTFKQLHPQDKYMLYELYSFGSQITKNYENFEYDRVLITLEKFVNSQVSRFYFSMIKDRLYCGEKNGIPRRACQTVLHHLQKIITLSVAPILPHIADEVHGYTRETSKKEHDSDSLFKTSWFALDYDWNNPYSAQVINALMPIRDAFFNAIVSETPTEFDLILSGSAEMFALLKTLQKEETSSCSPLCEIMQASNTSIVASPPIELVDDVQLIHGTSDVPLIDGSLSTEKFTIALMPAVKERCPRCRKYTSENIGEPCNRCLHVMSSGWES